MHNRSLILAGLLGGVVCGGTAHAQANFDPRALNPLTQPGTASAPTTSPAAPTPAVPPAAPVPPTPPSRPTGRPERREPQARRPAERESPSARTAERPSREPPSHFPAPGGRESTYDHPRGAAPAAAPPPPRVTDPRSLVVPAGPPPGVVLPPPVVVPVRPPTPPPPPTVSGDAAGKVLPMAGGIRVTFGAGSSDLNPVTEQAIRALVHAAPPFDTTTFTVTAYAPGPIDDPSSARRLSLSRALAVRSVLIEEGVASVRIYVKALGSSGAGIDDGPPDRVDIAVATAPAQQTRQP